MILKGTYINMNILKIDVLKIDREGSPIQSRRHFVHLE